MIYRDYKGRFASVKKFCEYVFSIIAIGFIGFATLFSFSSKTTADVEPGTNIEALVEKLSGEKLQEKIAELKHDLVRRLSEDCEAKGSKEPEGLIIFDKNGEASIGALQFQVKTVQHYWKQFYGKTLSRKDAILKAVDTAEASTLAEKIIFDEIGGLWNWKNCAEKLQLSHEVELLRKLSK